MKPTGSGKEKIMSEIDKGLANIENGKLFSRILFDCMYEMNVNDLELSVILKTSRPTIGRWLDGTTSPHTFIREGVYQALKKKIALTKLEPKREV